MDGEPRHRDLITLSITNASFPHASRGLGFGFDVKQRFRGTTISPHFRGEDTDVCSG